MKLGKTSKKNMENIHNDWHIIINYYMQIGRTDITIVEGFRKAKRQHNLFTKGLSTLDGYKKISKHQTGLAVDICIYNKQYNIKYDELHLSYVAGSIIAIAEMLYRLGIIEHKVRWGGDWNKNGVIKKDQKFQDLVHLELY